MMKLKKIFLSVIAGILGVFTVIGVFCFMKSRQIVNVFGEMYMAGEHPQVSEADFYHMSEMGRLTLAIDSDDYYMGAYTKTLNKGERISLSLRTTSATISIRASMEIKNTSCVFYTFLYDYQTKLLTLNPIAILTYDIDLPDESTNDPVKIAAFLNEHNVTREMVEQYQHYFLYEKLLTDWVNGNGDKSRFSMDDLGEFTVVDNTFSQLGEDWGR